MPELPEVETTRRTLAPQVQGRRITRLEVLRPQALRSHTPEEAARLLVGRTIEAVGRRGKALVMTLDGGWTLLFHFSLAGTVVVRPSPSSDAMTAALIHLDDGRAVEFRELQLSNLHLYRQEELERVPYLAALGPDPLDPTLSLARFRTRLAGRGAIRNLLADQTRLAGIGNLWSQEVLFAAGLRPARNARTLSGPAWERLYRATRTVLRRAIRSGGEPDFVDASGRNGRYRLAVYGRAGEPCRACKTPIATGRVGGRPAYWCPRCQR